MFKNQVRCFTSIKCKCVLRTYDDLIYYYEYAQTRKSMYSYYQMIHVIQRTIAKDRAVYSIQNTKVLHEFIQSGHIAFPAYQKMSWHFFEAFFGNLLYKCMKIEFTRMERGGGVSDPNPPPDPRMLFYENAENDESYF